MQLEIYDAILDLESAADANFCQLVPSNVYLMIGRSCFDPTEHDDFDVRKDLSPGIFMLLSGPEALCLLVCPAVHTYVQYTVSVTKQLAELLRLHRITIPTYYIFVGHWYL